MKRMVTLLLVVMVVLSMNSLAFASNNDGFANMTDEDYAVVSEKVSSLMSFVSKYQEDFGLASVDLENVFLSNYIPVYQIEDDGVVKCENKCYPLLGAQGNVIAMIIGMRQESGEMAISFTTEFNDVLSLDVVNQPICFLSDGEELQIVTEKEVIASDKSKKADFLSICSKYTSDIEKRTITKGEKVSAVVSANSVMNMLDVDVYKQASGTNTCWACCAVCVGNYKAGYAKRSVEDIVNKYANGNTSVGQTFYKVKKVLSDEYGVLSSVKLSSLSYSTAATNVLNDKPTITSTLLQNGFHAFVVCGYYSDTTTKYIAYMEPSRGQIVTHELTGSDVYYVTSGGTKYASQTYMQLT